MVAPTAFAEPLADAMTRMGLRVMAFGRVVDEDPVWSNDGTEVFVNFEGEWIGVGLTKLLLGTADWAGK